MYAPDESQEDHNKMAEFTVLFYDDLIDLNKCAWKKCVMEVKGPGHLRFCRQHYKRVLRGENNGNG